MVNIQIFITVQHNKIKLSNLIDKRNDVDKEIEHMRMCIEKYSYMPEIGEAAMFSDDGHTWVARILAEYESDEGYFTFSKSSGGNRERFNFCKSPLDTDIIPIQGDAVWVRNSDDEKWSLAVCADHENVGIVVNATYEEAFDQTVEGFIYNQCKRVIPGVKP